MADLREVDLRQADLSGADLNNAKLKGASIKPLSPAAKRKRDQRVAEAEASKDRLVAMLEAPIEKPGARWPEEE